MKVLLDDEMFDAQLLRAIGHTYEGGADFGECHSTGSRIKAYDVESWYIAWHETAVRVEGLAQTALERNHHISAYETYLRAAMYHRASGQFLIGDASDARLLPAFKDVERCFQAAMQLSPTTKCETVQIPYKEGVTLTGYFLRPLKATEEPRSTVIVNGGYDSVKEECYFFSGAAALRRGHNVLLFDGPGQGLPLLEQNLITIPNWENVMKPVLDYLFTRSDVDQSKVAAIGISYGGYLVPRAAMTEKRLSAIILDPAQISIGAKARARLPLPASWKASFPKDTPSLLVSLISTILRRKAADPSGGWPIRRVLHVHGLKDVTDMFEELDRFQLDPAKVTCPAFVAFAEDDDIAVEAKEFYEKVGTAQKKFVRFTTADGSGEHCECGNRASFNQEALDWLDDVWGGSRDQD